MKALAVLLLPLVAFLALFGAIGAAFWFLAHWLSLGWFAGLYVVGQLVRAFSSSAGESS